jgi:hypothetical protein
MQENVGLAVRHPSFNQHALVANIPFKCLQETQSIEKVAHKLFPYAECLVGKNLNVGMSVLEVVTRVAALNAKQWLSNSATVVKLAVK